MRCAVVLFWIGVSGCCRGGVCQVGYDTRAGARSATMDETGTQNVPPVADNTQLGEWVEGSDGSFGYRTATHAANAMFERVSDSVAKQCSLEFRSERETRADCNGIRVLVRHDDTNLYRVCPKGTEVQACISTWAGIP